MKLFKYQSTGNDFLCIVGPVKEPSMLAKKVCDRHFGIGADGILIAEASKVADIQMVYYNSDGSKATMCGNGLRAFTDFVYRQKLVNKKDFFVETGAGILAVHYKDDSRITISLNEPKLDLTQPDVSENVSQLQPIEITIDNQKISLYALMLGTLHAVVLVDDISQVDVLYLGSKLCHHAFFPNDINVNFVQVIDRSHLLVQTFERGAGLTLSCGTGVASSVVVTHHLNLTTSHVHITVPGGQLEVSLEEQVTLTGPTAYVASIDYQGVI
ncbi:MAG: diaminopimelate epimerase [Acholeplasmataceae bacterium]